MGLRKYLFWRNKDIIKTYKVTPNGEFEVLKPLGNEYYQTKDSDKWSDFYKWFYTNASIASDEYVDFCFISQDEEDIKPLFKEFKCASKSTWNKNEINKFCDMILESEVYKVFYEKDKNYVFQKGNIYDRSNIKSIYMRCFPIFLPDEKQEDDYMDSNEPSMLNKFFIEKLNQMYGS
ncbi:MAG: hypothetical protein K6F77_10430 [Lachnospiraceae bacterium]|nr:hypothetical protein [Lachnospiraceae bacterium]